MAVCAVSVASSAPAGALNGGITPGQTQYNGMFAIGVASDSNTNFSASVMSGLITFKPHRRGGQPITLPDTNLVNLSLDSGGTGGFGCWLIPASDVTVNADLSATFTFDSADPRVTECPGDPIGTTAMGAMPTLVADGQVQGIVGRLTATMSWTPASPIVRTRSTIKDTCGAFGSTSEGVQSGNVSTVSASVAGTVEGFNWITGEVTEVPVSAAQLLGDGSMNTNVGHINTHGPAGGGSLCGQFGAP